MRVAILDDFQQAWDSTDGVKRMRERVDVTIFTERFGAAAALQGFDVLVANRERTPFDRQLLEALDNVKLIVQTGKHNPHIDFAAARECGIEIRTASGGYSIGAAELSIALALAVTRRIPMLDAAVRRGEWLPPSTPVMFGKTLGVIGLGRVGSHVARIAQSFGMQVIAWSRSLTVDKAAEAGVARYELDDVLKEADVVSVHVSLNDETRGLIDGRRIALMKPTSCLINTARGPIVDEDALLAALNENRIAGAGLDVFATEPLPTDHPLTGCPNVVLTPHIGFPTDHGYEQFSTAACDALFAYLDGHVG
ncbi:MAG: D-2-hydroxyacid dehydrogenase family protein [Gammaproteobacteria bacterium]|nr:D-2-hydroxyacid dehydrogenase family protein [Gammaproteobacteria bacterium]